MYKYDTTTSVTVTITITVYDSLKFVIKDDPLKVITSDGEIPTRDHRNIHTTPLSPTLFYQTIFFSKTYI